MTPDKPGLVFYQVRFTGYQKVRHGVLAGSVFITAYMLVLIAVDLAVHYLCTLSLLSSTHCKMTKFYTQPKYKVLWMTK